jgi:hypothetical protein
MSNPTPQQRRNRRKPPTSSQQAEAGRWNNWTPGSGGKGWSPFDRPPATSKALTPECWRRLDGSIDWNGYYEERKKVGLSK